MDAPSWVCDDRGIGDGGGGSTGYEWVRKCVVANNASNEWESIEFAAKRFKIMIHTKNKSGNWAEKWQHLSLMNIIFRQKCDGFRILNMNSSWNSREAQLQVEVEHHSRFSVSKCNNNTQIYYYKRTQKVRRVVIRDQNWDEPTRQTNFGN